ncbi:MAG: hypothetical protein AAGH68_02105 [Pseudomonadota bacterium]
MTDQKKPDAIADDDLDTAQGGMLSFGAETTTVKGKDTRDSYANLEVSHARKPGGKDLDSRKIVVAGGDGGI